MKGVFASESATDARFCGGVISALLFKTRSKEPHARNLHYMRRGYAVLRYAYIGFVGCRT